MLVIVLLLYVVVRHRRRGDALPRQVHEHIVLELIYTAVPLAIVIGLFAVTFVSVRAIDSLEDDPDLVVEVTGFQWQWQFDYPASGARVLGSDEVIPELVLPAGQNGALRPDLDRRHPLVLDPGIPVQARHVPG